MRNRRGEAKERRRKGGERKKKKQVCKNRRREIGRNDRDGKETEEIEIK